MKKAAQTNREGTEAGMENFGSSIKMILIVAASLFVLLILLRIVLTIARAVRTRQEERRFKRMMTNLVKTSPCVTVEEFLEYSDEFENYVGVYVLYNKTQDMYYVGQATRTVDRLKNHLLGHGNGDVYADYKYGDEFLVSIIPYDLSQGTLNDMEANFIEYFDSFENGYNKTRGNHH